MEFLAMVRSLRATGCNLPVWVIPYDEKKFALPPDCHWWEVSDLQNWIVKNRLWPAMRKIQCLTTSHYQFVDSDVIFLKDPETVLAPYSGFVTSCTHWNNPGHTVTSETLVYFRERSTTWPRLVFNSGQWACDRQLYTPEQLMQFCENNYQETLFEKTWLYKDQAALNLLVNHAQVPIFNLTLPPVNMASTWAGDYQDEKYCTHLNGTDAPYLVHWAGVPIQHEAAVNKLFFQFLSAAERQQYKVFKLHNCPPIERLKARMRLAKKAIRAFAAAFS